MWRRPVAGPPTQRPPFFEGSLCAAEGIPLHLEESILLHEGIGKRLNGRLLVLGPGRPRGERLHVLVQCGHLQLVLLGLLLDCGPLRIALAVRMSELELQPTSSCLHFGRLGGGFIQPKHRLALYFSSQPTLEYNWASLTLLSLDRIISYCEQRT